MDPVKFNIAVFHQSIPEFRGTLHGNVGDVELERLLEWMPWTGLECHAHLAHMIRIRRIDNINNVAKSHMHHSKLFLVTQATSTVSKGVQGA